MPESLSDAIRHVQMSSRENLHQALLDAQELGDRVFAENVRLKIRCDELQAEVDELQRVCAHQRRRIVEQNEREAS